ncbi:AzlD domain-containing protein [Egicoccus sp. AB-alg6-2]|uniref:AzlD domain-containing protein n=1 Tax=Egicoccus sp. AB-alg6-2 TaxID=3242692 RepID=UPI00359CCE49
MMSSTMLWVAVLAGSLGCYAIKVAGLSVPDRVLERPAVRQIAGMLPVALLAALVAVQTFASGTALVLDARLAGVTVAVVAVLVRAPFLVVVLAAMATTALLRM